MSRQLDKYVIGAIPEPYVIMGVLLKPLSLGHLLLMQRFASGFLSKDPEKTGSLMDFLIAVCICSRKYEEFLDWCHDAESFNAWLKEFISKNLEASEKDHSYLIQQILTFQRYMKNSFIVPDVWFEKESEDAKESGAHWIQNIISALTGEGSRYSERELLDLALSKVIIDFYKLLENKGMVTLKNEDELILEEEFACQK